MRGAQFTACAPLCGKSAGNNSTIIAVVNNHSSMLEVPCGLVLAGHAANVDPDIFQAVRTSEITIKCEHGNLGARTHSAGSGA